MATTYRLRRKLFAAANASTAKNITNALTKSQAIQQGFTRGQYNWLTGNFGNAASGTKVMVNRDLLNQGNAALANAKTEAQRKAAQKMIDQSRTTVTLTGAERFGEAMKGLGKTGLAVGAVGTVAAGKKVNDAANGVAN